VAAGQHPRDGLNDDESDDQADHNKADQQADHPRQQRVEAESHRHFGCDHYHQLPPPRTTQRNTNAFASMSAMWPPAPARIRPGIRQVSHSVAAPTRNDSQLTSGSRRPTATRSIPPSFRATT